MKLATFYLTESPGVKADMALENVDVPKLQVSIYLHCKEYRNGVFEEAFQEKGRGSVPKASGSMRQQLSTGNNGSDTAI